MIRFFLSNNYFLRFLIFGFVMISNFYQCDNRKWINIYDPESSVDPGDWAPRDLVAEQIDYDKIKLQWESGSFRIEGFQVDRKLECCDWIMDYATLDSNFRTWNDTVSPGSGVCYYRLRAFAGDNLSQELEISITPSFPKVQNIVIENVEQGIKILWDKHPYSGVSQYLIEESVNNNAFQTLATTENTDYIRTGLKEDNTYQYRITSRAENYYSQISDTLSIEHGIVKYSPVLSAGHTGHPDVIKFSPDNKYILSGEHYADAKIRVWDIETGNLVWQESHSNSIIEAGFYGENVLSLSNGCIKINNVLDGAFQSQMNIENITSFCCNNSGTVLYTGGLNHDNSGLIICWDVFSGDSIWQKSVISRPSFLLINPQEDKIVSVHGSMLNIYDVNNGGLVTTFSGGSHEIYGVDFAGNGSLILINQRIELTVINLDGDKIWSQSVTNAPRARFFNNSTDKILFGDSDRLIKWNIDTGDSTSFAIHENGITDFFISSDNARVISSGMDFSVNVWDVSSERHIWTGYHENHIYPVIFSPNGEYIASGSNDKKLKVWNEQKGWFEI